MTTARHVTIAVLAFIMELAVLSHVVANHGPFWAQALCGAFALFVGWALANVLRDWQHPE